MIGETIDRYRIVEQLGQGGMGVVYKARDTVLERFVALKVLRPDKSSDPERRRRFLKEAQAASALNHSGIVAVYDVLDHQGRDVLVMELVEGETLDKVMVRGRLSLGEALELAIAIAGALARAHAAGIVHRDLKPSNVMVTDDGIRVLDFGLAKRIDADFVDPEAPTVATDESSLTRERAVIGTVAWMSPEQAAGDTVDARSDIFAFGVLLYEMLTGRHPFRRGSTLETLAAIQDEVPTAPSELVPSLPPEAERATLRCLHKKPERRWQSLSDLRAVLEDLKEDTDSGRTTIPGPSPRRRRYAPAAVAIVAGLVVVIVATVLISRTSGPPEVQPIEPRRLSYDAGASFGPTISRDGNLVAYASDRGGNGSFDIWVQHINQPEPTRLTDHPADDVHPRFSPDGSRIVFRSYRNGGGIYIVNSLGGSLRKVAGPGLFPQYSPGGGSIVASEDPLWSRIPLRRMFEVPVNGGPPSPFIPGWGVLPPPASIGPVWSPDGRLAMFVGRPLSGEAPFDWWVAPLDGGRPWSSGARDAGVMIDVVQFPSIWRPQRLLFLAGTTIEGVNLYAARVSSDGRLGSPVQPLTTGPGITWLPGVSSDGRIAFSRFQWVFHLWEVELDPASGRPRGRPRRITDDASPKFSFSLTADGDRLAYSTYAGPRGDRRTEIVLEDRRTGEHSVPVTMSEAAVSLQPVISADGALLSWRHQVDGTWVTSVASTGDPVGRPLCNGCKVVAFFNDGASVLARTADRLSRIWVADGRDEEIFAFEDRVLLDADLSHDEGWLAVLTGEPDGTVRIFAFPMTDGTTGPSSWIAVAGKTSWVGAPRWSADGRTLYFLSDRDDSICVWGRSLDPSTRIPTGPPFAVAHAHRSDMKMFPISRDMWTLEVGGDRLIFNAGQMTGDIYTAMLETD